jgi:hypothetical protein
MTRETVLNLPRVILGPRYADRNYGLIGETPGSSLTDSERSALLILMRAARAMAASAPPAAICLPLGSGDAHWAVGWTRPHDGGVFVDVVAIATAELDSIAWAAHQLLAVSWDEAMPSGEGIALPSRRIAVVSSTNPPAISSGAIADVANAISGGQICTVAVASDINPAFILVELCAQFYQAERRGLSFATSLKLQRCGKVEGLAPFRLVVASEQETSAADPVQLRFFNRDGAIADSARSSAYDVIVREAELEVFGSRSPYRPRSAEPGEDSKALQANLVDIFRCQVQRTVKNDEEKFDRYVDFVEIVAANIDARRREGATFDWGPYERALRGAFEELLAEYPQVAAHSIPQYIARIERLLANPPRLIPARLVAKANAYWLIDADTRARVLPDLLNDDGIAETLARYIGVPVPSQREAYLPTVNALAEALEGRQSNGLIAWCEKMIKMAPHIPETAAVVFRRLSEALVKSGAFATLSHLVDTAECETGLCRRILQSLSGRAPLTASVKTPIEYFATRTLELQLLRGARGETP